MTSLPDVLTRYDLDGIHPAAATFPMLNDEEVDGLAESAREHGWQTKGIRDGGLLIDGRNRALASMLPGVPALEFEELAGRNPLHLILDLNLHRRHLTVGQRAMIANQWATLPHGGDRSKVGIPTLPTQSEAAEMFGVSRDSVVQARRVADEPDLAADVTTGKVTLDAAAKTAKKRAQNRPKEAKPSTSKVMLALPTIRDRALTTVPYPQPTGKATFNETNSNVDWASWTWNPVTGCLHGCTYCYARDIANQPSMRASYPVAFEPLFHHERLTAPSNTRPGHGRPQDGRVFVCSMADLFGEWVPQDWIDAVFDAALAAPEWEYLFLTKFPQRYRRINLPPKAWFGASVDTQKRVRTVEKAMPLLDVAVRWLSIEPLLEPLHFNDLSWCDLLVIGSQTATIQPEGPQAEFAPPWDWVADLVAQARAADVPVYLKPNLLGLTDGQNPGMQLPQEMPRRRERGAA